MEQLDIGLSVFLLKFHSDVLAQQVNRGNLLINSNGIFLLEDSWRDSELLKCIQHHAEWVWVE